MTTIRPPYLLAAEALRARFGPAPRWAVVLGSGMGPVLNLVDAPERAPYAELGLAPTGVAGHRGEVVVGTIGLSRLAMFSGRVHLYEGRGEEAVARAVRALAAWGVQRLLLTSAVGGLHVDWRPGELVRLVDHLNLTGRNPLLGPNDEALGPRFPDMGQAYNPGLGARLDALARELGENLRHGVYAGLLGPSYETPAEIRMLARLGADVVGMSMVHEVIAAHHAGLEVVAIAAISNLGSGLDPAPLRHEDVTEVMGQSAGRIARLVAALVEAP